MLCDVGEPPPCKFAVAIRRRRGSGRLPRLWRRGLRRCAGTTLARVRARALGVRRRRGNCLVSRSPRWPADWVGLSPIGPLPLERRLDNQVRRASFPD